MGVISLEEHLLWRQILRTLWLALIRHTWNYVEGRCPVSCFQTVLPPSFGREIMTFLFDYTRIPGQVSHNPSSRICIVSRRLLALKILPAVLALALPHLKFVFPYFYAKIAMNSSLSLCSKTLLILFSVKLEAIENRRQLTSRRRNIFFSWINLSLNAVGFKSASWNFPVTVSNL